MKKFAFLITLLAMMSIAVSCSKDDDDDNISKNSKDTSEQDDQRPQGEKGEKGDNGAVYNVGRYEYSGTWKVNDSTVVADDLYWLIHEYYSQDSLSIYLDTYDPLNKTNYIWFNTEAEPSIGFGEFPIKQLIHNILPEIDIAHIMWLYGIVDVNFYKDSPKFEKEVFMSNIVYQYLKEGDNDALVPFVESHISPSGMSDKTLYYELNYDYNTQTTYYRHYTVVVTTKDGDYFGLSFNINAYPLCSILAYDRQTEMITLSLCMQSIDIIYKDGTRINERLYPEYMITFISNKIIRHYVGN